MKVKDVQNDWLLVWHKDTSSFPPMTMHYFKTKGNSICGKAKHPKNQPNALFVAHKICKTCKKGETK